MVVILLQQMIRLLCYKKVSKQINVVTLIEHREEYDDTLLFSNPLFIWKDFPKIWKAGDRGFHHYVLQ